MTMIPVLRSRSIQVKASVHQVLGGKDLGQQVLISKTNGKPALVISSAITDEDKHTKGVLAIGMSLDDISKKVATTRYGKTGYAILLDQEGKVISHINKEFTSKRTSLTDHPGYNALMLSSKESIIYTNEEGKRFFVRSARQSMAGSYWYSRTMLKHFQL
ncbi:MAG: cache domain-containing protein [Candidatus Thiodiazotropha sp. LLP2]